MEIVCIHIGMVKTATTYIQDTWGNDPTFCVSHLGCLPLIECLQEQARTGHAVNKQIDIRTDRPFVEGQKVVISNEAFSTAFMNGPPEIQNNIYSYISLCSESLGNFFPDCHNLLLVVRDPKSWIKSIYKQWIKEGNFGDCQHFINTHEPFLKATLDLKHIVTNFGKKFNNILILPYELLKNNQTMFWQCWSGHFSIPIPRPAIKVLKSNVSAADKNIYLLSCLNRLSTKLFKTIENSVSYQNFVKRSPSLRAEWDSFQNSYFTIDKWVHRRFAEYAKETEIDELYKMFHISSPSSDFFDITISPELGSHIKENFFSFLRTKKLIEEQYIDLYESNLSI